MRRRSGAVATQRACRAVDVFAGAEPVRVAYGLPVRLFRVSHAYSGQ
jgi:hypothetical protein